MNVFELVKDLKKSLSRRGVVTEISVTRDELTNIILPLYNKNAPFLRNTYKNLNSKMFARDREDFLREFTRSGYLRGTNVFDMINTSLTNALTILDFLDGYFGNDVADEVNASSLTIAKSTALHLLGLISFTGRYASAWLNTILSAELNSRDSLEEQAELTLLQIKYLNENRDTFAKAISIIATPVSKVSELLEEIPEVVMAEANQKAVLATLGRKADPFKLGLIQSKWDPIWLGGMFLTDLSVNRYKALKEEAAQTQMKIHRFKAKLEMKDDPKLQAVIMKNQEHLDKLNGKIHQMEESIR